MSSMLGIDFGTSTTVAVMSGSELLFDSSPLLASAVFDTGTGLLTGADALRAAVADPQNLEANPKRTIDHGEVWLRDRAVSVVDLIAAVLARVGDEARRVGGGPAASVTLTHPATWGASRLGLLTEAAARAGLGPVTLLPEPLAAAAYFADHEGSLAEGQYLVVYDLGAGTFDVSVVHRTPHGFDVVATGGLDDVGGRDLDHALLGHVRSVALGDTGVWGRLEWPQNAADQQASSAVRAAVRAAKEQLSRHNVADLYLPLLDARLHVTREEFETVARPYLQRTADVTVETLRRGAVPKERIAGVFLVGGSSRIPLATTLLHRTLRMPPTAIDHPELAVARGSLAASQLLRQERAALFAPPPGPVAPAGITPQAQPAESAPATPTATFKIDLRSPADPVTSPPSWVRSDPPAADRTTDTWPLSAADPPAGTRPSPSRAQPLGHAPSPPVPEPLLAPLPASLRVEFDQVSALIRQKRATTAVPLAEHLVQRLVAEYGSLHPYSVAAEERLVDAYASADRTQEAITRGERLLEDLRQGIRPDDDLIGMVEGSLSVAYHKEGRFADAVRAGQRSVSTLLRTRGPNHFDTIAIQEWLSTSLIRSNRADEGLAVGEQALAAHTHAAGPMAETTVRFSMRLAACYRQAGRLPQAIALAERNAAAVARMGLTGDAVLYTQWELFRCRWIAGQFADAVAPGEHALRALEAARGRDDAETVNTRARLAVAYLRTGRELEAVGLAEQVVPAYERLHGRDHPETFYMRLTLVRMYVVARRQPEAIALGESILAHYDGLGRGPDRFVCEVRLELAAAYANDRQRGQALTVLEDLVAEGAPILGSTDPLTLTAQRELARMYVRADRAAEAVTMAERAVAGYTGSEPRDDEETAMTWAVLAEAYLKEARYRDAVTAGEAAARVLIRVLGPDHRRVVRLEAVMSSARDALRQERPDRSGR